MSLRRLAVPILALAALAALPAGAAAKDHRLVKVEDRCDPATFNEALGPGACVPVSNSGDLVTFGSLLDTLAREREHDKWRFDRDEVKLDRDESLVVRMTRGGEFHTFTEVPEFGKGCVPELNHLVFPDQDPSPAPYCTDEAFATTGIGPGGQLDVGRLERGTHRFICLIHPWMKTTAKVR